MSVSCDKLQGPGPLRPGCEYFLFFRFFCRILPLKCWPRSSMKFYIHVWANDSPFTSTDLAVFVHWSHFKTTARRLIQVTNYRGRIPLGQEANMFLFCPFFCRVLPLKCWPRSSVRFYIRANDSQFTSTDLAVIVHLSHFKTTARRPFRVTCYRGRVPLGLEANIFLFCRFFCMILPLKCWKSSSVRFYVRANDSQFTSTDLAVFVHLSH